MGKIRSNFGSGKRDVSSMHSLLFGADAQSPIELIAIIRHPGRHRFVPGRFDDSARGSMNRDAVGDWEETKRMRRERERSQFVR